MRRGGGLLVLLGWLLLPAGLGAQPLPAEGALAIEGKQVPLPPGPWQRAGVAETPGVVSVALVQRRAGEVTGVVLVQANPAGMPSDWGIAAACRRSDLPFARVRYASDHSGSCAWVAVTDAGAVEAEEAVDPAWAAARTAAELRRQPLPRRWAVVGVRVTDAREALQVRYAMPLPPGAGVPESLLAWAETAAAGVEHGLLNLPNAASALPAPPAPPEAASLLPRAVWKTLTFRAVVTTLDFTGNVLVIGNWLTAALLSTWSTVIGPFVYLGHELIWEHLGAPAPRLRELPGLGPETPPG